MNGWLAFQVAIGLVLCGFGLGLLARDRRRRRRAADHHQRTTWPHVDIQA